MAESYLKIDVDRSKRGDSNGYRDDFKRDKHESQSKRTDNVVDFLKKVKHWKLLALFYLFLASGSVAYLMNYHSANFTSEYLVKSNYLPTGLVLSIVENVNGLIDQDDPSSLSEKLGLNNVQHAQLISVRAKQQSKQKNNPVFELSIVTKSTEELPTIEKAIFDYLENIPFVKETIESENQRLKYQIDEMLVNANKLDSLEAFCNQQIAAYFSGNNGQKSISESSAIEMSELYADMALLKTNIFEARNKMENNKNFVLIDKADSVASVGQLNDTFSKVILAFLLVVGFVIYIYGVEFISEVYQKLTM